MQSVDYRRLLLVLLSAAVLWAAAKYLLPAVMPFLLGSALALAAEPAVKAMADRARLPRPAAAFLCVSLVFAAAAAVLWLLAALFFRELGILSGILPDMGSTITLAQDLLLHAVSALPEQLQPMLNGAVLNLFSDSADLFARLSSGVVHLASALLGRIPGSALVIGTAILSAFMISARLPTIRSRLRSLIPPEWQTQCRRVLSGLRHSLGGWVKAQTALAMVTFLILTTGFFLLRISYAPFWAGLIALVDAIPVLGTGTVLLPWAVLSLLQGSRLQALGLAVIWVCTVLTRSALEPRFVGSQLGLDPLVTLAALYIGLRFWGLPGVLLAPFAAMAVSTLFPAGKAEI